MSTIEEKIEEQLYNMGYRVREPWEREEGVDTACDGESVAGGFSLEGNCSQVFAKKGW